MAGKFSSFLYKSLYWIENNRFFNLNTQEKRLNNILTAYPPLLVEEGEMTAQYEHTICLTENKKIIFSRGEDY